MVDLRYRYAGPCRIFYERLEKKMGIWLFYVAIEELDAIERQREVDGHGGLARSAFSAGY